MRLELLPLKEKTTTATDTNHKKKRKITLHPKAPELQKGLMRLTCFWKPLGSFWLAEFLTPSSLQAEAKRVRQAGEGRENANVKNSSLPENISKQTERKNNKSAYGGTSSRFYSRRLWRGYKRCSVSSHPRVFLQHMVKLPSVFDTGFPCLSRAGKGWGSLVGSMLLPPAPL